MNKPQYFLEKHGNGHIICERNPGLEDHPLMGDFHPFNMGYITEPDFPRIQRLLDLANKQYVKETSPVKYGCHCDLEPGQEPDHCVFDTGNINDCVNAVKLYNIGTPDKTLCAYWKPIE